MKILVCSTGYNSNTENRIGVFQLDQARALLEYGYDVRIVSLDLRSFRRKRKLGTYLFRKNGMIIATSNFPYGGLPLYSLKEKILEKCAQKAYSLITKDGWIPDIIHAHFCDVAYAFSAVAKEENIPFVVTEHYSKLHKKNVKRSILHMANKAYEVADQLIAVSNSLAKSIQENTGHSATVIPNIVDTDIFRPTENKKKYDYFTFVSAGHLKKVKGMDILLQAFSDCKDRKSRLVIMGDGVERVQLAKIAKQLNISERVVFKGEYKRSDFQLQLSESDCFILASRSETFGVVYVEAMAAGIPVIGTRCGGPEEVITSEVGVLVPTEDVKALTEAMDYMIDHKGLYSCDHISQYAKSTYGKKQIIDSLQKVYCEVINSNE